MEPTSSVVVDGPKLPVIVSDSAAVAESVPESPWLGYVAGGKTETGDEIRHVVHATPLSAVFINARGQMQYRLRRPDAANPTAALAEATDLVSQLKSCVRSLRIQERGLFVIGVALGRALERADDEPAEPFFERARAFVAARRREKLHIVYLAATILVGILCGVSAAITSLLAAASQPFVTAIALGAAGGVVSVLLRFKSIEIETYTTPMYVAVAGIARVVFGASAGVVFVLTQRAGLILSFKGVSADLVALGCFVAGFSERLLPDLLEKLEQAAARTRGPGDGLLRNCSLFSGGRW